MSAKDLQNVPFLPDGRTIQFLDEENEFLTAAREAAEKHASGALQQTGAVVVREGKVLGKGANTSEYHAKHGCRRKEQNIPTGEQYELCPGCDPRTHAEQMALADAISNGHDPAGADLYLWGHWWCCQSCWEAMIAAGINRVFLVSGAKQKFVPA